MLALLAAAHFLVDTVATTVNPLWPSLEKHHSLAEGRLLWAYMMWAASTSFTQLAFGYFGDRCQSRWLLWMGPLLAIVCLSCLGLAQSPLQLGLLLVLAGLGVSAFHPEAAATAGSLIHQHRSRAMAIFALSGYLGQSIGPVYSGLMTDRFGPQGLIWTAGWALPVMLLLSCGLWLAPSRSAHLAESGVSASQILPARRVLALLLAIGTLRIMPALGVPLALAYVLEAQQASNASIGFVQGVFMAGIGAGGILCALAVHREQERRVLWIMPSVAAPMVACLSMVHHGPLVGFVAVAGFLLGIAMPVYISYGQQLLPHRQGVASSITMGVSWGLSGGLVAAAIWLFQRWDMLAYVFVLFAATCLASSLFCRALPHTPWEANTMD